jgi:hypothetical protein
MFFDATHNDSAKLVKRSTLHSGVRQSVDGENTEKDSSSRDEWFKAPWEEIQRQEIILAASREQDSH